MYPDFFAPSSLALNHYLVEDFSVKGDNGPVGMNGASADTIYSEPPLGIGNFHIRVALSTFVENLNSHVYRMVVIRIVGYFVTEQNERGCAFVLRKIFHL